MTFDGLGEFVKFDEKLKYSGRVGDSVIIFDVKLNRKRMI